ncbi:MAG: phosphatidylglycerol lysyltransferase domain-containing protein [Clostridium sp.]|nr:phosphatidylglycerol lysyltransferase domain-containing protein [Clostridium sp.]
MAELIFETAGLKDYERIYRYTSVFGEGSCQHSFVSMYSAEEKYGDAVCEADGFLYTLRQKLCDDCFRVYLAPMGDGNLREAFRRIMADAHKNRRKAKFVTLTKKYAAFLEREFAGQFVAEENRDLAEYVYRTENMAAFPGRKLKKRRDEVHHFWNLFGGRAFVSRITQADFSEILDFESIWVQENKETHDGEALEREERMIRRQFAHFDELALSGVVLRIDGIVKGFGYGTKLSDTCYDAIVEKGDRDIPHIYKVLRQESVKQCAMDCAYVNMEEDVGVPGLRALKYAYQPEFLICKYIVTER